VSASVFADPIYPTPLYSSAPIVGSPVVSASGSFYGGGFAGDGFVRGGDGFIRTSIRNEVLGDTLDTFIPGTGGIFSTLNDVNVLRRAPDFFDSTITGRGYRRDPVGSFVRNNFFADRIGKFIPGASASLNAFNRVNLLASLL
jgi:hypothetical protein